MSTSDNKEICIFCFDEFNAEAPKVTENIIGCPCKYMIHEHCWARWNIYECPICHKTIEEEDRSEEEQEDDLYLPPLPPVQVVIYRRNVNQPSILYMIYAVIYLLSIYMLLHMIGELIL
jgi:hypothetical protein